MTNPFQTLSYEPALESLGNEFFDIVQPATFPQHILHFRNDALLPVLGLKSEAASNRHFIEFFGRFQGTQSCLALRYHGHQFGQYNPYLGDGRGFLYGQVRGVDGHLYDFGTKGSGTTPHSHAKDGRLSLKGAVREALAGEILHYLGVPTSRCLSLIETGEDLQRDDEPSPARSAVMVRQSRSHIRFGTFERLDYYDRPDLIKALLDFAIACYYPELWKEPNPYPLFYTELVKRVAQLVGRWMAIGFCHGVLNTDNMSIVGEGFDYGPYAFIETYNPYFTAASFDRLGRYSYRNQPNACRWNLEMLQRPLSKVMPLSEMAAILESFPEFYTQAYEGMLLKKLGFLTLPPSSARDLVGTTLEFLLITRINYHQFFDALKQKFSKHWYHNSTHIVEDLSPLVSGEQQSILKNWCEFYHWILGKHTLEEIEQIEQQLWAYNPTVTVANSAIEIIWEAIDRENDWQPFNSFLQRLRHPNPKNE
ncbi:MAG: YdiU family protein [Cyanobacteria bacterium SBLK]|nr:YdiU family protein [Cyanobacteria bacterium SBLK]